MSKITKAVIPAAGYGSRFLPITKAVPKEMLALVDKPALQYIVEEAADSGITDILLIISEGKEAIVKYFDKTVAMPKDKSGASDGLIELLSKVSFEVVYQKNLDGTAGALKLAKDFTGGDAFAVMYGDDVIINKGGVPCVRQLIDAYEKKAVPILGVQNCSPEDAVKYAVVTKGKEEGRYTEVLDLEEKPALNALPSTLSSLGRYILTPDVYDAIERIPTVRGEKYLTSAVQLLAKEKSVWAYDFEGKRYDIGDKLGYAQANFDFAVERFGTSFKGCTDKSK